MIETSRIEIGFSSLGPTVDLLGTIHAHHRAHFVEKVSVRITRVKDSATHTFDWARSRPFSPPDAPMVHTGPGTTFLVPFQIASGQLRQFSYIFTDSEIQSEFESLLQKFQGDFSQFLMHPRGPRPGNTPESSAADEFVRSPNAFPYHKAIQDLFYWNSGRHRLQLEIRTTEPNRVYDFLWHFDLTQAEVDGLKSNIASVIKHWGGGQTQVWSFAHVKYISPE